MIKFFRKIRYELMEKSKTIKYLKYAFGEILLVMMGILLALQVNNWNESQKDETETHIYLTNLRGALNDDIASLESNISFNKTRLKGIFYILEHSELEGFVSRFIKPKVYQFGFFHAWPRFRRRYF